MRRDDEGSILPLTIFFGFLSLVLVLVVVAATSLYIERKRLYTVADGAALVGAEAFTLDEVAVASDGSFELNLRDGDVATAVNEYLDGPGITRFEGLTVGAGGIHRWPGSDGGAAGDVAATGRGDDHAGGIAHRGDRRCEICTGVTP